MTVHCDLSLACSNPPKLRPVIDRGNYRDVVWASPVRDLLYVGAATEKRLHSSGIDTIGGLTHADDHGMRYAVMFAGSCKHLWLDDHGWYVKRIVHDGVTAM